MSVRTVAFLGCGRITRAVVEGLVGTGRQPQLLLRGVSRDGVRARALAADFGAVPAGSIAEAVDQADLVVLAVHPHQAAEVLAQTRPYLKDHQLLLSLVASWPTIAVADAVRHAVPVLRAVPNVAVAARAGATVLCTGPGARSAHLVAAEAVFRRTGQVFVVDERHMESVSALSGAGPALLGRFARALADGAVAQGLPPRLADDLAGHVLRGTGALLAGTDTTFESMVAAVASPGGMTEQALDTLERFGLADALAAAIDAAVRLSLGRMPATT